MQRGIDHLVLCVDDLAAAQQTFQTLGFTTTPPAYHPFGTANCLVQLQGNFLELLAVYEPEKIGPPKPGQFAFATFSVDFLRQREGFSMLVFESRDARADQAEFTQSGLQTYPPFDFSRLATLPDGSEATVSFSLAFVTDPRIEQAAFFVCQQHAPEYFWRPEYQRHDNSAQQVNEALMVAAEPAALADLYGGLQAPDDLTEDDGQLTVKTARGMISVLTPARFAKRFPGLALVGAPSSPYFAGYGIEVVDLAQTEAVLHQAGVKTVASDRGLRVADAVHGAVLEFQAPG